jgi:hypothetical protein
VRRALIAVSAIALCTVGALRAWAQAAGRAEDGIPLKLWLAVAEPEVCTGTGTIALRIEIENISEHGVRIDPHRLAFQVSASRENQVATTTNDSVALVPGDFRELTAGASYKTNVDYKMSDPIFGAVGLVRVVVRYGQLRDAKAPYEDLWKGTVASNAVLVRLRECGARAK